MDTNRYVEPFENNVPIYLAPPHTPAIREHVKQGHIGAIMTPAAGNKMSSEFRYWAADNSVFSDKYPGDAAYLRWLEKMRPFAETCLFVMAPDVVADHHRTVEKAWRMLDKIREMGFPVALAAQNGMEHSATYFWDKIDCLFIAGDDDFKLGADVANIASVARSIGKWVHMGRVNSLKRYLYAHEIGCHSVDGTTTTAHPTKNLQDILFWTATAARQQAAFQVEVYPTDHVQPSARPRGVHRRLCRSDRSQLHNEGQLSLPLVDDSVSALRNREDDSAEISGDLRSVTAGMTHIMLSTELPEVADDPTSPDESLPSHAAGLAQSE